MERVKKLESSTEESPGIEEAVCIKVWFGTGETLPITNKGKENTYKLGEVVILMGGSRRGT